MGTTVSFKDYAGKAYNRTFKSSTTLVDALKCEARKMAIKRKAVSDPKEISRLTKSEKNLRAMIEHYSSENHGPGTMEIPENYTFM